MLTFIDVGLLQLQGGAARGTRRPAAQSIASGPRQWMGPVVNFLDTIGLRKYLCTTLTEELVQNINQKSMSL